jgi:hypothetical protein
MMSHFSDQIEILIDAKVPFTWFSNVKTQEKVIIIGTMFARTEAPSDDYRVVSRFVGDREKVDGYSEFYTEFWFDKFGNLTKIGLWE